MHIRPIRNAKDLKAAFLRLEQIFQAPRGSVEADERDVLVTLIEVYEDRHWKQTPVDPVSAIRFRMEQQGLSPKDLEPYIGSSGRVSVVLNGRRPLSFRMIRQLHAGLHIPYESLLAQAS